MATSLISRAFLKNSFWVSIRYVFLAVAGIVITMGFARLSTKETLGQYQFVISLLSLFSIATLPGLNIAALKSVSNQQPAALLEAVRRSFLTSFIAIPFLLTYAIYLYIQGNNILAWSVGIGSLFFPFFYAPNTWYTYYEGQLLFRPVAIKTIAASALVTVAVLLGLYFHLTTPWILAIFLGVSTVSSIFFYWQVKQEIHVFHPAPVKNTLDLAYGRRVTIQKFVYTLSESLPPLTIGFLLGQTSLASFQVAYVFLAGVSGLIGALAAISLPQLFTEKNTDSKIFFGQNVLIGLLACIGYYVAVELLFLPMYGAAYHDSFRLAQVFAALPLAISLKTYLVNYFTAYDQNRLIITVYLFANAIAFIGFLISANRLSFTTSLAIYIYSLQILLFLPLCISYFLSRQQDS